MAPVNTFPQIPLNISANYVRTFPQPSPYRRFPVNGPQITVTAQSYQIVTLATLRGRVRERLLQQFWADAELNAYIQEAFRMWNTLTGYYRYTWSQNIGQGVTWIDLNQNIPDHIALLRAYTQTGNLKLVSLDELDGMSTVASPWQSTPSNSLTYAAVVGCNFIAMSPTATSNTLMLFDVIRKAPVLENDTDYVQIGEEDLEAILGYVYFVAKLKEGTSELQSAIPLMRKFLDAAAKYNSTITQISAYRKLMGIPGDAHVIRANSRASTPWRNF